MVCIKGQILKNPLFLLFFCVFSLFYISCENQFMENLFKIKTISFDAAGGSPAPAAQKLFEGETVSKPADPAKENSVFLGWFDNEDREWDFGMIPESSMTLYAKWEAAAAVHYTLILDTDDLADGDSVSFNVSDVTLETSASGGSTVRIYYTLGNTHNNNWLLLYIDGDVIYEIVTPGTGYYDYIVNSADADNFGVITIQAYSIHSNLNPLHPPAYLVFDKTGIISYTANNDNPADTTYRFTLYRGNEEVSDFTSMPITSGIIPENIVNKMLKITGDYHVKVWAATNDPGYDSSSIPVDSQKVHVYQVSLTINGVIDNENVNITSGERAEENKNIDFVFNAFSGDVITLTANPGTNRYVTWSGAGTSNGNTCTVTVTGTTTVTAAFAVVPVTVTSGSASTGYNNLDDAFKAITTAGDYTVTLFANQSMTSTYTLPAGSNITLKGSDEMRTITYAAGIWQLFEVNANSSLTIGNNITIKGRSNPGTYELIRINNGTLIMEENSCVKEHNVNYQSSAAICIIGNGRFIMRGGTIADNNNTHTSSAATGGVYINNNGYFEMRGGSITGNTASGGRAEDVYMAGTTADRFIISGNSNIGSLKLNATNATAFGKIHIGNGFFGSVGLSLRGDSEELVTVINWWEGKQILQGEIPEGQSRRVISPSDVGNIYLGNFYSNLENNIQKITPSFNLEIESGILGILKIHELFATVIVNANGVNTFYYGITTALASITTSGDYIVTLKENQSMTVNYSLSNNSYINITLEGEGMQIISCNSASGALFTIYANTSLTIGNNITIQGRSEANASDLIRIENGTLTMDGDSIIRGHNASNVLNAAISVGGTGGSKFVMNGGTITGNNNTITETNAAGGVYVGPSSIFEMRGGKIINNTVGGTLTGNIFTGGINEDLYVTVTIADKFILSGNANIGSLKLNATSSISFGKVHIGNNFSGKVGLNLFAENNNMATVFNWWTGKEILQGELIGGVRRPITTDDINKFTLGNFYSSEVGESQAIGNTHRIGTEGADLGKLVTYKVGDTGPAGGIIIYHDPNGFTVQGYGIPNDEGYFATYTAYYLEAAPANASSSIKWSGTAGLIPNLSQNISDTTDRAIGRGRLNTALIAAAHPDDDTIYDNAAKAAAAYTNGGKNDWFLPSFGELNEMYKAKGQAGIPTTSYFWSSSQCDINFAWDQNFLTGNQDGNTKDASNSVRAIRAF